MGCTLITTSSKPRLSSAFRFKRRQGATGAGNSPSVSEGVAEGRGSNMSVKIPCAWLAARGDALSLLRSQRVARCARAERLAVRAFYVTQKSRKSQKITRCASKWARFARWRRRGAGRPVSSISRNILSTPSPNSFTIVPTHLPHTTISCEAAWYQIHQNVFKRCIVQPFWNL